ncbi:cation diffusion facilitator family transporter [Kitasatospora sp. DSM 101779]|uniref:cation diffusion facilitator family transporter n=1 Tax=Kitasatospora sp. DSM 101779 TaxID=2853165 RepID=UPI0021D91DBB|nr:cation diffusion facilitator family transporter [Kitasatospora sp. DSM 101779]
MHHHDPHHHDAHHHDPHGHGTDHHGAHPHHTHGRGVPARLGHLLRPHSHHASDKVDEAMDTSADGLRTLWISLLVLALAAVLQAAVVLLSDSVALLGDTVHNVADALTAVPLAIAFLLGRRAANRSFTYGYGRAEDLAGVAVVATVAASAVLAAATAVDRLLHPQQVGHLWAVAAAAVVGCLGNEWVARYRIRTGRRIGSAALVADGIHARADGLTSLAVLLGAGGSALGWRVADPLVGLVITAAILVVLRSSVREVGRRLMDGVEPALVDAAERGLREVDGVRGVGALRMRWVGHALRAEAEVAVDGSLTVAEGHRVAEAAEQALKQALPRLVAATVHIDTAEPPEPVEPAAARAAPA